MPPGSDYPGKAMAGWPVIMAGAGGPGRAGRAAGRLKWLPVAAGGKRLRKAVGVRRVDDS